MLLIQRPEYTSSLNGDVCEACQRRLEAGHTDACVACGAAVDGEPYAIIQVADARANHCALCFDCHFAYGESDSGSDPLFPAAEDPGAEDTAGGTAAASD